MINLEIPKKFAGLIGQSHQIAAQVLRANSRRYDAAEHEYPRELDMVAALIDGVSEGGALAGAGASAVGGGDGSTGNGAAKGGADAGGSTNRNGSNMASLLGLIELSWGDVG
ncbi:MAG: acyl-CoA dehydrogenase family protein, partial [Solirubrobacteraceae bacterium]